MALLEQLQQLRKLVHALMARVSALGGEISALGEENVRLRRKLSQYEGDIEDLSQNNRELEKSQQLVETEVGELLNKLQELRFEEDGSLSLKQNQFVSAEGMSAGNEQTPDNLVQTGQKIPQVSPLDSLQFLEQRKNVEPQQVNEADFEPSSNDIEVPETTFPSELEVIQDNNAPDRNPNGEVRSAVEIAMGVPDWGGEIAHSLDVSLGQNGDSLLTLDNSGYPSDDDVVDNLY